MKAALAGLHIWITRPSNQAAGLIDVVAAQGAQVVALPLLEIAPPLDMTELDGVLAQLDQFDMAIFVSPSALDAVFDRLSQPWPADLPVGVMGPGSAQRAAQRKIPILIAPSSQFDSAGLLQEPALQQIAGKKIVVFRGDGGRSTLPDTLQERGAEVRLVSSYRRLPPAFSAAELQDKLRTPCDGMVVSSSEAVQYLFSMAGDSTRQQLQSLLYFAPHPRIIEVLHAEGANKTVLTQVGDAGICASLVDYFSSAAGRALTAKKSLMPDHPQDSFSAALQPASPAKSPVTRSKALYVAIAALAISAGAAWYQVQLAHTLKDDIGRDIAANEKFLKTLQATQESNVARQMQLEARFSMIEARLTEARSQQEALARMYDALTRSDTVRVLAEIEQTLTFASLQLQLTGNISAAQTMLASVDAKLTHLNRPELINVRQALAKDMDALKALPALDLSGIIVNLDNLAMSLDSLPLAIDAYTEAAQVAPRVEGDWLTRAAAEIWHDIKQLVRIRRMDKPDAQLLSPEQAVFVRANMKLHLLDARTALLMRDEATYRSDLKAVLNALQQHFDPRAPLVSKNVAMLEQYGKQALNLKVPDLGSSLAAARDARAVAERVKQ